MVWDIGMAFEGDMHIYYLFGTKCINANTHTKPRQPIPCLQCKQLKCSSTPPNSLNFSDTSEGVPDAYTRLHILYPAKKPEVKPGVKPIPKKPSPKTPLVQPSPSPLPMVGTAFTARQTLLPIMGTYGGSYPLDTTRCCCCRGCYERRVCTCYRD